MVRDNTTMTASDAVYAKPTRTNPLKAMVSGTRDNAQISTPSPTKSSTRRYLTRSQTDTRLNTQSGGMRPGQPLGELHNLLDRPTRKPVTTEPEARPKSLHKRTKSALSLKGLKGRIWDDNRDEEKEPQEQEHPLKSLKHSKKSKSSTSLSAFLARPKSKGKDTSGQKTKSKESHDSQDAVTESTPPIWAQFATPRTYDAAPFQATSRDDEQNIEAAFEAVLESRNVPKEVREKMRTLDTKLKAEFIRQHKTGSPSKDQGSARNLASSTNAKRSRTDTSASNSTDENVQDEGDSPKKPRPRSFQLPLGIGGQSPTKKQKGGKSSSHTKTKSVDLPRTSSSNSIASQISNYGLSGLVGGSRNTTPEEFIAYLKKSQKPQNVEVGKLQRLRQLLRNETVEWVDTFISSGGMEDVVDLLYRILDIEWRDEHDDSLLHHTLNCLKALATTDKGLEHLSVLQEKLFPTLIKLLFSAGEERKAPSEYTTRDLIMSLVFAFLRSAPGFTPAERAEKVLAYLRDPEPTESERPPGFIMSMRKTRPFKAWHTEFSSVTKEVFWIFLHSINVIPYPETRSVTGTNDAAAYLAAHFPAPRAPVAAAPYVGGVEWEATNYLATHLDVMNGVLASLPTAAARNAVRRELRDSGFERVMGCSLRTCKQKFYGGVHEALATFVGAGRADGWDVRTVREGPPPEPRATPKATPSPAKGGKENRPPILGELKLDAAPRPNLKVRNPDIALDEW